MSNHSTEETQPLSRLKLVGVKIGRTLTQNIASTLLSSQIAATAIAAECTAAATSMTVAQAQLAAEALAVVRVSVANNARMQQVLQLVTDYAAKNPAILADFERMSATNTAALSFKSNIVGSLVAGAIQEAVAVAYYLGSPHADVADLKATTQQVAATTAASLAFSAGGAAVGAVLLPGAGAVLGSLVGGVGGGYITGIVATSLTAPDPDRQRGFGPQDTHLTFAPDTREEADYVLVLLPDAPSCTFDALPRDHDEASPTSQTTFLPAPREPSEAAWSTAISEVDAGLSELVLLFQCLPDPIDPIESSRVLFASHEYSSPPLPTSAASVGRAASTEQEYVNVSPGP